MFWTIFGPRPAEPAALRAGQIIADLQGRPIREVLRYPGELYTPSPRGYQPLKESEYPFHHRTICVTRCGRVCVGRHKINLGIVFAVPYVGIREVADEVWLASIMHDDLGFFDQTDNRVEPVGENPFAPMSVPMCPEWIILNRHSSAISSISS